jgi:hypothetical protein
MTLDDLNLNDSERAMLRRNGHVSSEKHRGRTRYKLRFRDGGQQKVRSLGYDAQIADAIQNELAEWQSVRHTTLKSRCLATQVTDLLRSNKRELLPYVLAAGYRYHGRSIRRRRYPT